MLDPKLQEELQHSVDLGVKYLETEYEDWRTIIDLEKFNIADYGSCVLAQAARHDDLGTHYMDYVRHHELSNEWAITHGFNLDNDEIPDTGERMDAWLTLQALWEKAIKDA